MRIRSLFSKRDDVVVDDPTCGGTLVVHADGTLECEHQDRCECDEVLHELWVSCDELRCGCVGEDAPLPLLLAA